jgi:hypothetical protein
MEEIWVDIINKYIKFYKKEIRNVDLFEGMNIDDYGSTSEQMELFNNEIEKYKCLGEEFQNIDNVTDDENLKKYIITKNSKNYLTSNSLLSLLIEIINLEKEDTKSRYDLTLKDKIKKVKFSN